MKLTVRLFASLRDGRFEAETRRYGPDTTVGDVLADLGIPESAVKLVFVNNRHARADVVLRDGDVLGIFPPIGGG